MSEFPFILEQAISEVRSCLDEKGLLTVTPELIHSRVKEEDHESLDYRSRPLEERLRRIFGLEASTATGELLLEMCNRFMTPIFARGKCYEDTLPALKELRSKGVKACIVSNTSWGSPAELWRSEIRRLGLDSLIDSNVFDRDVGWRKPSERIFKFAMKNLGVQPDECLFVGDEPKWDLIGPRAVGIEAILIDRKGDIRHAEGKSIKSLHELSLQL
jgi:putative hydrolase of the HAD superfamily